MHLVGFIIRIYHDAWSPERQIHVGMFSFQQVQFVGHKLVLFLSTARKTYISQIVSTFICHTQRLGLTCIGAPKEVVALRNLSLRTKCNCAVSLTLLEVVRLPHVDADQGHQLQLRQTLPC